MSGLRDHVNDHAARSRRDRDRGTIVEACKRRGVVAGIHKKIAAVPKTGVKAGTLPAY